MQFSVSSGTYGVIQRATFLAFGDSNDHSSDYTLADMTSSANVWVQRVSTWIWQASSVWELDDMNQTDLPGATTTLVEGQKDYTLPDTTFKIKGVQVMDTNGNWHELIELDERELNGIALQEFMSTDGLPIYFRVEGSSLFLYPGPTATQVTLTSGLHIDRSREFLTFSVPASYTTADATQPGFDEQFHEIICRGIAYDFTKDPAHRAEIEALKKDMFSHYGMKNDKIKVGIRPHGQKLREYR